MVTQAQQPASDDRLMKPGEIARLLGISRQTLNEWVRLDRIPSICISSRTRRFVRSEVEAWLRSSRHGRNGQQE